VPPDGTYPFSNCLVSLLSSAQLPWSPSDDDLDNGSFDLVLPFDLVIGNLTTPTGTVGLVTSDGDFTPDGPGLQNNNFVGFIALLRTDIKFYANQDHSFKYERVGDRLSVD